MIIPEHERSSEPMKGERVITHPDMQRANEWILREYRVYVWNFCVFVPVSGTCPVT